MKNEMMEEYFPNAYICIDKDLKLSVGDEVLITGKVKGIEKSMRDRDGKIETTYHYDVELLDANDESLGKKPEMKMVELSPMEDLEELEKTMEEVTSKKGKEDASED